MEWPPQTLDLNFKMLNALEIRVKLFHRLLLITISRTQGQLLYNRFKKGRDDVNDDVPLSTTTTDVNIKKNDFG